MGSGRLICRRDRNSNIIMLFLFNHQLSSCYRRQDVDWDYILALLGCANVSTCVAKTSRSNYCVQPTESSYHVDLLDKSFRAWYPKYRYIPDKALRLTVSAVTVASLLILLFRHIAPFSIRIARSVQLRHRASSLWEESVFNAKQYSVLNLQQANVHLIHLHLHLSIFCQLPGLVESG